MTNSTDAHLAEIQARAIKFSGERDLELLPVILRETLEGMGSQATREGRMWARIPKNLLARLEGALSRRASEVAALRKQIDLAEQAIAEGPHGGECAGWTETPGDLYDGEPHDEVMNEAECDCWKAEYDAAKEADL